MKILHIITGLDQGGAQSALYRLVTSNNPGVEHVIVSIIDYGIYGFQLREAGVEVHAIGMNRGKLSLSGLVKLWKLVRKIHPDVVQTWMYHADLIGGIISKLAGFNNICWGVVNFNLHPSITPTMTILTAKFCGLVSGFVPKKIVSCSERAIDVHVNIGYSERKMVSIPLGFDLNTYFKKENEGILNRQQWGVKKESILIGCVARWDPQKDHKNLILAMVKVRKTWPDVHCALIGPGMDADNLDLVEVLKANHNPNVLLTGTTLDIPTSMSALDLHILPSLGEAFPNVVAEAMACEIPCIVTDVGDAAIIVGETGWVVPPGDSEALAQTILIALNKMSDIEQWQKRTKECRLRINEFYSEERMVSSYTTLWRSLLI